MCYRRSVPAAQHAGGRPSRPPPAPRHAHRGQRLPTQPTRPSQEPPRPHRDRRRGRAGLSRCGHLRQCGANLHSHSFAVSSHRRRIVNNFELICFPFPDAALLCSLCISKRNQGSINLLFFKIVMLKVNRNSASSNSNDALKIS